MSWGIVRVSVCVMGIVREGVCVMKNREGCLCVSWGIARVSVCAVVI